MNKNISFLVIVIIAIIGSFYFGVQWQKYNQWTGVYYPDKTNLTQSIISPPLQSLSECRSWANSRITDGQNYDYECGSGCNTKEFGSSGPMICKNNSR